MKIYIITGLCVLSNLNGMEEEQPGGITRKPAFHSLNEIQPQLTLQNFSKIKREPREWDAQVYDESCKTQTEAFLEFLSSNKINIHNKTVLDIGCGTGKIAEKLAKQATHVHAFDASENMINLAKKQYDHLSNISFEHCFAEDFTSSTKYQLAIASHSINWFEDKKEAFKRINNILEENGEFFANIQTKENPIPLNLKVAQEKIKTINPLYKRVAEYNFITGSPYPSNIELRNILTETGFEILKYEEQSLWSVMTKDEIIVKEQPLMFDKPIMQYVPNVIIKSFFDDYITQYLSQLIEANEGQYLEETTTTIVHARKIKK